jgi:hypothetical protein
MWRHGDRLALVALILRRPIPGYDGATAGQRLGNALFSV